MVLGSQYAGEMKKGLFTMMHHWMPDRGVLSMHSSCNEGMRDKDITLMFGLSGTGKTTLSADPKRRLIGDDEHCWTYLFFTQRRRRLQHRRRLLREVCRTRRLQGAGDLQRHQIRLGPRERQLLRHDPQRSRLQRHVHHSEHQVCLPARIYPRSEDTCGRRPPQEHHLPLQRRERRSSPSF